MDNSNRLPKTGKMASFQDHLATYGWVQRIKTEKKRCWTTILWQSKAGSG